MLLICNGMKRSGSTLQYNLVRTLIEKTEAGEGHGYSAQFTDIKDMLNDWGNDSNYHVVKTHKLHPETVEMTTMPSTRILYIYRDVRDVAVSLKRAFKIRREETLLRTLDDAVRDYYQIKNLPGVLWQKYEDVVSNLPVAVCCQANFLNLDPTEALISQVVKECSIENSKRIADDLKTQWGFKTKLLPWLHKAKLHVYAYDQDRTLLHHNHISNHRGSVGIWRTELTEREAQVLTSRYRKWLQEEGYELSL